LRGIYYAGADKSCGMTPAILRTTDFKNLLVPRPKVTITEAKECGGELTLSVASDRYAHGVHFGLDDDVRLSDEYFDLLPGEAREVTLLAGHAPIAVESIRPRYVFVRP